VVVHLPGLFEEAEKNEKKGRSCPRGAAPPGGRACSRGRVGGAPRVVSADGSGRRAGGAASTLGPGPGLLALLTPEA